MLQIILITSNSEAQRSVLAFVSDDAVYEIICRVSLEFGSSARVGAERELLNDVNAVFCPGASVACWMDTILCVPFSSMITYGH